MKKISLLLLLLSTISLFSQKDITSSAGVNILLIGDSTTKGGEGIFETSIENILNTYDDLPKVKVINGGKGGETAFSLFETGRYDKEIKGLGKMDYIFVRYGINDANKRKPISENFPIDLKKVVDQLKIDFPSAQIILTTIIPFLKKAEDTTLINQIIKNVATNESVEYFDVYPAYNKALETLGENAMNVRFVPLSSIPANYQKIALPYVSYVDWKKTDMVRVLTTELDPFFSEIDDWFADRHPNPTGYRLLAHETVKYMIPKLKKG